MYIRLNRQALSRSTVAVVSVRHRL